LPDQRAARRGFAAAAATFDDACFVHDETRARLLARLDLVRLAPRTIVDLGCATGRGARALAARYRDARVVAVDSSAAMLRAARGAGDAFVAVTGDAERLPLRDGAVQLVLANLTLPWCDPRALFAEAARVLEPGGLLPFTDPARTRCRRSGARGRASTRRSTFTPRSTCTISAISRSPRGWPSP
jgi:malonyl-CoA O-methyltransferase